MAEIEQNWSYIIYVGAQPECGYFEDLQGEDEEIL